jgi:hypothetical protein
MLKRKGGEFGMEYLIMIILAVAAAILIFFVYQGSFGKVADTLELAPSDQSIAASLCSGFGNVLGYNGYCNDFKKIETASGDEGLYSCWALKEKEGVEIDLGDAEVPDCTSNVPEDVADESEPYYYAIKKCQELQAGTDYDGKTYVNGGLCTKAYYFIAEGSALQTRDLKTKQNFDEWKSNIDDTKTTVEEVENAEDDMIS